MEFTRCFGCMEEKTQPVCEHCGWDESGQNGADELPVGSILKGKYVVGRVLCRDAYSITYLGWDLYLEVPLSIKEYYPDLPVKRRAADSPEVQENSADFHDEFEENKKRFLTEAQILECCSEIPEVVKLRDFFPENNTSYIVMEYLKGRTLKEHVALLGRSMTVDETMGLLRPLFGALDKIHASGLLHRNLDPEDIMILPGGKVKLLNFAPVWEAGYVGKGTEFKNSFLSYEQYRGRGEIGPWSDVYALCATLVYCMTGKVPPNAEARMKDDLDEVLRAIPGLKEHQRKALERGMELVDHQNRTQSVRELEAQLMGRQTAAAAPAPEAEAAGPAVEESPHTAVPARKQKPRKKWLLGAAAAVVVLLMGLGGALLWGGPEEPAPRSEDNTLELSNLAYNGVKKSEVRRIEFLEQDSEQAEQLSGTRFDLSRSGNGGVEACLDDGELYILCDGPVYAPVNSEVLFGIHDDDFEHDRDYFKNLEELHCNGLLSTEGVENMSCMFQYCAALEELDLSGFDTAGVTDMDFMFNECSGLKAVDLSSFDTSQVETMGAMFQACNALEELDLSGFNTAKVTDMGYMFNECSTIRRLDLGSFDTARVVDMSSMFQDCTALESVNLMSFNTAAVETMRAMFSECGALSSLVLTGFDTSLVTTMEAMFNDCASLERLDLSSFNTASVTNMDFLLSECYALESVDVSSFNTEQVTTMRAMFQACQKLKKLDLSHFDTSHVTDMAGMFQQCSGLESLNLNGFHTDQVKDMESMFKGVSAECEIDVGEDLDLLLYLIYIGLL